MITGGEGGRGRERLVRPEHGVRAGHGRLSRCHRADHVAEIDQAGDPPPAERPGPGLGRSDDHVEIVGVVVNDAPRQAVPEGRQNRRHPFQEKDGQAGPGGIADQGKVLPDDPLAVLQIPTEIPAGGRMIEGSQPSGQSAEDAPQIR